MKLTSAVLADQLRRQHHGRSMLPVWSGVVDAMITRTSRPGDPHPLSKCVKISRIRRYDTWRIAFLSRFQTGDSPDVRKIS